MNRGQALEIVSNLSHPGKMPCYSYNLPANACITGSKLAKIPGTICNGCYALGGWYVAKQPALYKRLEAIKNPLWTDAMIFLIQYYHQAFFRWHDSGDIQSLDHLYKIIMVAECTPFTNHWLPTREWKMIEELWEVFGRIPLYKEFPNLVIRLSSTSMNDKAPIELAKKLGVTCSAVSSNGEATCPAMNKTYIVNNGRHNIAHGHCGSCRNCWDQKVKVVVYQQHKQHRGRPVGS